MVGVLVTIGYDYMFHFYSDVPQGHWFQMRSSELIIYQFSIRMKPNNEVMNKKGDIM